MICKCKRNFKTKQSFKHHQKFCNGIVNCCKSCGKTIERPKGNYCNTQCHHYYYYKINVEQWLSGEISGNKQSGHRGFIKLYLKETYGNKCSICGWSKVNLITGNVPIELDHIDGNNQNNKPENVRLLCPNCHSLTPTYKALNKGNGRAFRLKGRRETMVA